MSNMRAKFKLESVSKTETAEVLKFRAVGPSGSYPADGRDEDNTYAKFTPSASCEICITNADLFGKFQPGESYFVDFTKVG